MQEGTEQKRGRGQNAAPTKARKDLFIEMVCRYYLKGLSYKQIVDAIKLETGTKIDWRTVSKYIKEAIQGWQEQKPDWAEAITVIELQKINLLEAEYWAAYQRSKLPVKSKKQKIQPAEPGDAPKVRKRKNGPPVIPGFKVLEEIREEREQNGDVKFLLGVQWCIEQRLLILGHTGAKKSVIEDKDKEEKLGATPAPGKRVIQFTTTG